MAEEAYQKFIFKARTMVDMDENFKGIPATKLSFGSLEARKNELNSLWSDLKLEYETCYRASTAELDQNKKDSIKEKFKRIGEVYYTFLGILLDSIEKFKPTTSTAHNESSHTNNHGRYIKVPPCDVEPFSGDYESWPTFRDSFESVYIDNESVPSISKLKHLRNKCKKEAFDIAAKFKVTGEQFEYAWAALKDHYENVRMLVNNQLKRLFALPNLISESAAAIKRLHNSISSCLHALNSHDIDTSNWDPILIFLVSQKLPAETLALWEQNVKDPKNIPKWEEMDKFLESRYLALEAIADVRPVTKIKNSNSYNTVNDKRSSFHAQRSPNISTSVSKTSCKICSDNHPVRLCPKFLKMNVAHRQEIVKRNNCCYNCLASSHNVKNCQSEHNCNICGKRHHTLLHKSVLSPQEVQSTPKVVQSANNAIYANQAASTSSLNPDIEPFEVSSHFASQNALVLLATAVVKVQANNKTVLLRALLDPGSTISFLTESAVKLLDSEIIQTNTFIHGVGNSQSAHSTKKCEITLLSRIDKKFKLNIETFILDKITGKLPVQEINYSTLPYVEYLPLADPFFRKPAEIQLLLGADVYPFIICNNSFQKYPHSPLLQKTVFGYVLCGPCSPNSNSTSINSKYSFFSGLSLDQQIQKFWELEEVAEKKPQSDEDKYCEELFQATTRRCSDGKYIVNLPFRKEFPTTIFLGMSRCNALKQFYRSEKTLAKRPQYHKMYNDVLSEYLLLNHMTPTNSQEIFSETSSDINSFYLPHHGIFKPEKASTKLRVVFNGSCGTSNGTSLNDMLYPGPTLQNELIMIIHRWRKSPYVFTADIQKMYRQIWVNPDQSEYQRILFRESPNDLVRDFKLMTVTFGINCAPYLAIRTLLQLAKDERHRFPIGSDIIERDFYVDDVLSGGYDIESTIKAKNELTSILQTGGFPLKKWASNCAELLKDIESEDKLFKDVISFEDSTVKALGLNWNIHSDCFTYRLQSFNSSECLTKRKIFSNIARLFDPAGWISPIIITAKILMQSIWCDKTDWDELIAPERLKQWHEFANQLQLVEKINIPRYIHYKPHFEVEYHGFCDASNKAIAASFYIRIKLENGNFKTSLISSKTKVSPLKVVSLPRLELCGAVLLAKLVKSLQTGINISDCKIFMWTDSTIVLAWLRQPPSRWKTFIANRVSKILNNVGNIEWKHVRSEDNPADLASRGVSPETLLSSKIWWYGPTWLSKPKTFWPTYNIPEHPKGVDFEERPCLIIPSTTTDILDRFSSFDRMLRVLAYVNRFLKRINPKSKNTYRISNSVLQQNEIHEIKRKMIILTQKRFFFKEYNNLQNKCPLDNKSMLLPLNPFLDSEGVMRSNGRLLNSALNYNEKFPVIIPYASQFAKLVVAFIHKCSLHGGNTLMLYLIRTEYWIPKVKNLIKTILHHCKVCLLYKKNLRTQLMGALPPERAIFSRPFSCVGIDYAGPLYLKLHKGRAGTEKGYACIFICFCTKAIHLECVSDLSSESFKAAFTRFVSRRGLPSKLYSDNGTNFIGAKSSIDKEIRQAIEQVTPEVGSFYATRGLDWSFIPPGSPHMGGLWEAGVKAMKFHLKRVIGQTKLTFEEYATLFSRIEACLNSRPISPISDNPEVPLPLTPGHFLSTNAPLSLPEPNLEKLPLNTLNRWQTLQLMQQSFANKWKDEYLKDLQKRYKWKHPEKNVEKGDLVAVMQEHLPPTSWRLGRVVEIHPGKDKRVRVVTLKTQQGMIKRAVNKLVFLPMND